jgi:Fuc2NAc and GlcNAc transferase
VIIIFILVLAISSLLTGWIRGYAISRQLLDFPNQRSSHNIPTARGGGLAIVTSFFFASGYLFLTDIIPESWFLALSPAILVAMIGFCDDHADVAARWRILIHLGSSYLAIFFLNGLPLVSIPKPFDLIGIGPTIDFGWFGVVLCIIALAWSLNLFNFMDGIDGLAASEAVFVSTSLACFVYQLSPGLSKLLLTLAFATLGFLTWNWPKAKIFMGDVGSGFLGLLLGILILLAAKQSPVLLYCGLCLFGLFIVDASYTLSVRIVSGQKWHQAHCSHTYQLAAKLYGHLAVLSACWLINLCWLLPLSWLIFLHPAYALVILILAYLPLVCLAYWFKAGRIESVNT